MKTEVMKTTFRLILSALFLSGMIFFVNACDKDCENDPDCIFIQDGRGGHYEEIDVQDGKCDCA